MYIHVDVVAQVVENSIWSVECCGFESHPRQLIFLWKIDCLGYVLLLCFVVCMTLLASFFLHLEQRIYMHIYVFL